jgi:catechol 2,3-dioxygenase-like lactoylglutathione lyase family enzyme
MFKGAHFLIYSTDAEADRAFARDVLGFRAVDAGDGWLILALPPAELAFHPTGKPKSRRRTGQTFRGADMYLMCDDLQSVIAALKEKGVTCAAVTEARWGASTTIRLPGGSEIGIYQPRHVTAIAAR